MSKHRRAAKVDGNQKAIVELLRSLPGVTVQSSHDDILVGHQGRTFWFEVKSPDCISPLTGQPQPSKIKKSQEEIRKTWTGHYSIVWDINQILEEIGHGLAGKL